MLTTTDRTLPHVFKLMGEVDLARQDELAVIEEAAAEARFAIVDLSEVTFLDSTALNWLLRTKKTVEEKRGWLRVVAPTGMVTRLVSLAGLQDMIDVFPTQLEAADS